MIYEVIFTDEVDRDLGTIADVRTRNAVIRKALDLDTEPDKQGKTLSRDLGDYRVVRAAGQRYRVIYQVASLEGVVTVVVVGIRKEGDKRDVYRVGVASRQLGKG